MRARAATWTVLALAALGFVSVACELIAGIDDNHLTLESRDASDGGDANATNECVHAEPPPRLEDAADGDGGSYLFALRTGDMRGRAGSLPVGFDLDGVCTCDPRETKPPSCIQPKGAKQACDADGGIDFGLDRIWELLDAVDAAGDLLAGPEEDARCGRLTLLLALSDYNGTANDPSVKIAAIESHGILDPPAAGEIDAGCQNPTDRPPTFTARWDGTDRWSVPPGTFAREGDGKGRPVRNVVGGWVRDFQLVLDARVGAATEWPILVAGSALAIGTPVLRARLVPLGDDGAPLAVSASGTVAGKIASFRLEQAVLSGRARVDDALSTLGAARVGDDALKNGPYVCANDYYLLLKPNLCQAADIMASVADDHRDRPCDGLSLVFQFEASPVQIGRDYLPDIDGGADGGCGPRFRDTCP